MRRARLLVPSAIDGVYHVVNRVVDRRRVIGDKEKRHFLKLARMYAEFGGLTLLGWCVMDNHFHLLVQVPSKDSPPPDEAEVLRRMALIYAPEVMEEFRKQMDARGGNTAARRRLMEPYLRRMGDLGLFMKTLQQRFTQWFNRIHARKGTLWEERYRSVVVEGLDVDGRLGHAARVVAAYIDLNPLRAGVVEDPKDGAWCGYGAAVRGDKLARQGLEKLWGKSGWEALAAHRRFLFEEGSEERTADGKMDDRRTGERKPRKGIAVGKVRAEQARGGRLPIHELFRQRVRYMVDGGVFGSREFVERVTGMVGEKKIGVVPKYGQWGGMRVLRDLQKDVIG